MKNGSGGERLVGSLLIAGAGSTSCGRPDASSGSRGLPRTGNHSPEKKKNISDLYKN